MPDQAPRLPSSPSAQHPETVAISIVSDDVRRAIVSVLGESDNRPLDAGAIADRAPLNATSRLVRDRIRDLERAAILTSTAAVKPGDPTRWTLTVAGQELYRLLALMTRIVVRASDQTLYAAVTTRDAAVSQTLAALADPLVREILRALIASDGLGPTELEEACPSIPRRTLYRRLSPLVDVGAVARTITGQVPRATTYAIHDRWRPVASILLLSAWWATRHRAATEDRTDAPDAAGLLLSVLPLIRGRQLPTDTEVDWVLARTHEVLRIRLSVRDGAVRVMTAPERPASATITADDRGWASALVAGNRDGLAVDGDDAAATAVLNAVRGALLSYIR